MNATFIPAIDPFAVILALAAWSAVIATVSVILATAVRIARALISSVGSRNSTPTEIAQ